MILKRTLALTFPDFDFNLKEVSHWFQLDQLLWNHKIKENLLVCDYPIFSRFVCIFNRKLCPSVNYVLLKKFFHNDQQLDLHWCWVDLPVQSTILFSTIQILKFRIQLLRWIEFYWNLVEHQHETLLIWSLNIIQLGFIIYEPKISLTTLNMKITDEIVF